MDERDDNIEPRVAALEAEMAEVRERLAANSDDATAARVLAAGADRDVSEVRAELRAHRGSIDALGRTTSRLQRDVRGLRAEFGQLRGEFGQLRGEMRAGFGAIATRLDRLIGDS